MRTFQDFLTVKEGNEPEKKGAERKITLGKNNQYEPFMVTKSGPRKNLSTLIRAFNEKVSFGPKTVRKAPALQAPGQEDDGTERKTFQKKLYLVGGAVRDHLAGNTPNDYDLATDATMDEIRMILKNAGFSEIKPQTKTGAEDDDVTDKEEYEKLPKNSPNKKKFWVQGTDIQGNEFVMGIKVNNEEFELATFRKDAKGGVGGKTRMVFTPNIEDDAARRDFTINAMYIPLTNDDGPNNQLLDYSGGFEHLLQNKVRFVGDPKERLGEDELRALRYARFTSQLGDIDVPEEYMKAIEKVKDMPSLQKKIKGGKLHDRRGRIREEFLKGLKKPNIDPKVYVSMYKKLGLLDTVFPGMSFKLDTEGQFSDKKEKHLAVAWILRENDPDKVYDMLIDSHWTKEEAKRIRFLIAFLHFHPEMEPEDLEKYRKGMSGVSTGYFKGEPMGKTSSLMTWADMNKDKFSSDIAHKYWKNAVDSFLQHASMGDVKVDPEDPKFADLFVTDIHGKKHGTPAIGVKQKELAAERYKEILQKQQAQKIKDWMAKEQR
jgi:tRNA nucleotidyltransferase/poly(A) polymerase